MDYALTEDASSLRRELRALVAEHLPPEFLGAFTDDPADQALADDFCRLLASKGLLTLAWPKEYGGRDGSVWTQTVLREEMWAHHEPRGAQYMGLNWVGPAIMRFGTAVQRAYHLPLIAGGKAIWCQGFSEPNAGSDLASLRTRANASGPDRWRIDGQKVWTSYAPIAQFCMLAARTSTVGKPRDGITLFMLPMDLAGIEVRPIRSMLGPQHLNEVFFTGVVATGEQVLGEVDHGWEVIRYILDRERVGIARYARADRLLNAVRRALDERWPNMPTGLKLRFVRAALHSRQSRMLAYRAVDLLARGELSAGRAAAARIAATRGDQEAAEVMMELLGEEAVEGGELPGAPLHGAVEDFWRYSQAATVASGALEIQQSLVAKAALEGEHGTRNA